MRNNTLVAICLLALSTTVLPSLAHGQFQNPTPEELKMTSDPQYPDAAAEYLNYEEKTEHEFDYHSVYARIKIFKDSAKDVAGVRLGYLRGMRTIDAVRGRTIHPDGTIVPMTVRPEDLLQAKQGEAEAHEVVFTLPSVEAGSILEYYYQIRYDPSSYYHLPEWEIQKDYPLRKGRFYFAPARWLIGHALMWNVNLPPGMTLAPDVQNRFVLEIKDMPALHREEWAPPAASLRYSVSFFNTGAVTAQQFWTNNGHAVFHELDRFASPSPVLKQAAEGIVQPGDSAVEKAKKLYAAVQALDNTDFSRAVSKSERKQLGLKKTKNAEDTWTKKSGDSEDITLLYLALLRAAGLNASAVLIANRDERTFNTDILDFNQLNGLVILLNTGTSDIVLDPGEKMCPFQTVSWKHSGAGGLRESEKGITPWITPLQLYTGNTVTRRAEVTVAADGSVTGKIQLGLAGQEALYWRQASLRMDSGKLGQEFEDWLRRQLPNGLAVHFTRFAKLEDPGSDLGAYATVEGMPGTVTAKRILLPGSLFVLSDEKTFVDQPQRKQPVDMHFARQTKDGVLYHLPAGYKVEGMPQTAALPWSNNAALQYKSILNGNNLTVVRALSQGFTLLEASEYGALRDYYQKVAAADQQQIVLTLSEEPKGN